MAERIKLLGGLLVILALSVFTYVPGYQKPAELFWDENFHIASAQRYLHGVFFLEPHPPLGKMLIALGERVLQPNAKSDQFIGLEKAETIPEGFSFAGYRLFSVLFAALIAPLLYTILYAATGSFWISGAVSIAPIFDNALIVHSRGAMLEGPQLVFILLAILSFIVLHQSAEKKRVWLAVLGASIACALLVKVNSAAIIILPVLLFIVHPAVRKKILWVLVPGFMMYLFVWYLHFGIGQRIEPSLDGKGYFGASSQTKEALSQKALWNPAYLPQAMKDAFSFSSRYQEGVPTLNYCKEDENGSYPLLWPLGSRSIQYRWDDAAGGTRYLYLVPNPGGWLLGLLGVFGAFILLGNAALGTDRKLHNPIPLGVCMAMYLASWLAPLGMQRVFYLYHYFVPLTLSWILFGMVCHEVRRLCGIATDTVPARRVLTGAACLLVICPYLYLKPLTYHQPVKEDFFSAKWLLSLWDLRCKTCGSILPFVQPVTNEVQQKRSDPRWKLAVGTLQANYIEQSIGKPAQLADGFEIMTRSRIQFPASRKYTTFSGIARLPQEHLDGEVEFKIIGDGVELWTSGLLNAERSAAPFSIAVQTVQVLVLVAKTPKEGLPPTYGRWQELVLRQKP